MTVHPYFKKLAKTENSDGTWNVPNLCRAYSWPTGLVGGGVIGIVELGGGWNQSDVDQFCNTYSVLKPSITDISVDGTVNSPGSDADGEVELDIQVVAASYFVATGKPATIRMYWAQDIPSAVIKAANDGCDTISISWGQDEAGWGIDGAYQMDEAAKYAVLKGSTVFAAAGDNDSSDGGPNAANVDCPGSCPWVVCCGGTKLVVQDSTRTETVWNDDPGETSGEGTGGGYSTIFKLPSWQAGVSGPGRMVPDVSANADPVTGYNIVLDGEVQAVGGTSAVAPLYASLFASFGKKLGFVTSKLYLNPVAFNDITVGNNGAFRAKQGPDPCTGLGSPIGMKLVALFVK